MKMLYTYATTGVAADTQEEFIQEEEGKEKTK